MEGELLLNNQSDKLQKPENLPLSYKLTTRLPPRRGHIKLQIFKTITKTIASTPVFGGNGGFCRRFRPLPITPAENLGGGFGSNVTEEMKNIELYSVPPKRSVSPKRGEFMIFKEIAETIGSTQLFDGNGVFRRFQSPHITQAENSGGGSGAAAAEVKKNSEYYSVPPKRGDVKMKIFKEISHAIVSTFSASPDIKDGEEDNNGKL